MSGEKPLHVQVAEALGGPICYGEHRGEAHRGYYDTETGLCKIDGGRVPPRYDTDWSATGPLIEILLRRGTAFFIHSWEKVDPSISSLKPSGKFQAYMGGDALEGWGDTPQAAICNLILALHAAGKLEAA